MRIGVLSDIHGDMSSLERALTLFHQHGVDTIICAGDIVEKGNEGDGVVARLRKLNVHCVQGNHDENAIRHDELSDAVKMPGEVPLKRETIEYLKTLPSVLELTFEKTQVLVTHAIPSQNAGRVFHEDGRHRLSKRFKKDLAKTSCEIVIVGHTHRPFDIQFREKRVINPGATCALKERDSNTIGILELPSGRFQTFNLTDGSRCKLLQGEVQ